MLHKLELVDLDVGLQEERVQLHLPGSHINGDGTHVLGAIEHL